MASLPLIANPPRSPQMQMLQQAKQNHMQRDPSGMDANRDRPSSPASGENAPSPSKRQRIEGAPFNPNQPGGMMPNGRPIQGMPGQQMPNNSTAAAHQMLAASGINPNNLNAQQFANFASAPPAAQQKSIATYAQTLQQHHSNLGGKQMPSAGGPQGQGSPMMAQGPDGSTLTAFYNPNEMGPGGMRAGPNGPQAAGSSNHALQDYQMQLMLLEQQNKKRLMMARQEQDTIGGATPGAPGGPGGPGGPPGPNGQPFADTSPQAMRTGASPNPAEQMKRGTPQMNNSSVPSPVPDGGQSRGSPNPNMAFMANHDPNMNAHFNMQQQQQQQQQQMNGMRPPSSHPGQPFNGQMTQQQMMAARQAAAQQQGQPGQQPQGAQGNPQQWQPGPNGQMVPQNMQQQSPQIQGTPQQRSMPPPSAPVAAGNNANNRTTASPQQAAAAPPTPNQGNKAAPKKKKGEAKEKVSNFPAVLYWHDELTFPSARTPRRRTRVSMSEPPQLVRTAATRRTPRLRLPSRPLRRTLRMGKTPTRVRMDSPRQDQTRFQLRLLRSSRLLPHKLRSFPKDLQILTRTGPSAKTLAGWYVYPGN